MQHASSYHEVLKGLDPVSPEQDYLSFLICSTARIGLAEGLTLDRISQDIEIEFKRRTITMSRYEVRLILAKRIERRNLYLLRF